MTLLCLLLATAVSIWDYPARYQEHNRLRRELIVATRAQDRPAVERVCQKGIALLPDDPTWHYNLACALAQNPSRQDETFRELEKAIDLGFRQGDVIEKDRDFAKVASTRRFKELVEYAREMSTRPLLTGPLATVDATGAYGDVVALGEQNLIFDFNAGMFIGRLRLLGESASPWAGDLYMNRDRDHSPNGAEAKRRFLASFPGLTEVRFDFEGRRRGLDLNAPNIVFTQPTFGNCSRAFVGGPYWRSIPRALVTTEVANLDFMKDLYLLNQVWVFPANADVPPVGTHGDVFASITPYWLTTAGASWSDLPYLRAALLASGSFTPVVKAGLVRRHLLAPTIMTLIRKSLVSVAGEDDYTSPKAHPSALPPQGVDTNRLQKAAAAMTLQSIPPLAAIAVETPPLAEETTLPELTYRTPFAWAYVLRGQANERVFTISATGAEEFRFVQTHGESVALESISPNAVKVTINKDRVSPTNRVDIAVFGRNKGTGFGAPSYVCFASLEGEADYVDPVLKPPAPKTAEPKEAAPQNPAPQEPERT